MTSTPADAEGVKDQLSAEHRAVSAQLGTLGDLSGQYIRDLVDASREQTNSSDRLARAMVVHQERAKLAARRYRITILVIVAFFTALLVRQEVATHAATSTRDQIVDCIVPTGQCYKNSQEQTAKFLNGLNQIAILRAACQPSYETLPLDQRITAIQHCIQRHLR